MNYLKLNNKKFSNNHKMIKEKINMNINNLKEFKIINNVNLRILFKDVKLWNIIKILKLSQNHNKIINYLGLSNKIFKIKLKTIDIKNLMIKILWQKLKKINFKLIKMINNNNSSTLSQVMPRWNITKAKKISKMHNKKIKILKFNYRIFLLKFKKDKDYYSNID